jgi:hypothetical protein
MLIAADNILPPGTSGEQTAYFNKDTLAIPIVIDSGATMSLTPVLSDFITPLQVPEHANIRQVNGLIKIEGVGQVRWHMRDLFGSTVTVETTAYYIPCADVRLFSPQVYLQDNPGGEYIMQYNRTILQTNSGETLVVPYHYSNNLPMILPNSHKGQLHSLHMSPQVDDVLMSVGEETNQNLTGSQKELLNWHWRLGHIGFQWLQTLMRPRNAIKTNSYLLPPLIPSKCATTKSCSPPLCAACQLGKMGRRNPGTSTEHKKPEKFMALKDGDLLPGQCVSLDQYESEKVRGRLPHTRGKEKKEEQYCGGTIMVDHASGLVFLRHQVSLRTGETLMTKQLFERFANQHGIHVKNYHGDNGVFNSQEFVRDVEQKGQTINFSGTGAHHQNGVAE